MNTAISTAINRIKSSSRSFHKHEQSTAFWYIFPALALLLVFVFYPMLQAFVISFKNYSLSASGTNKTVRQRC